MTLLHPLRPCLYQHFHFLLALFLLHFCSTATIAQVLCSTTIASKTGGPGLGGFCVYSSVADPAAGIAQFRVEVYEKVGWASFGFGSGMTNAETFIFWKNPDNTITLSARTSINHIEPIPIVSRIVDYRVVESGLLADSSSSSMAIDGQNAFYIVFNRTYAPVPAIKNIVQVPRLNGSASFATPMIWALNNGPAPPTSKLANSTLSMHEAEGVVPSATLFSPSSAYVPPLGAGTTTSTTPTPSPSSTNTINSNLYTITPSKYRAMAAHGVFMFFAWLVFAPIGFSSLRYMKNPSHCQVLSPLLPSKLMAATSFSFSWFNIYGVSLLFGVFGCSVIGFGCITYTANPNHYDVWRLDTVGGLHVIFGLLMFVLLGCQTILGLWSAFLQFKKRITPPSWLTSTETFSGRFLVFMATLNIPFGLYTFNTVGSGNNVSIGSFVCVALWMALLLIVFSILEYRLYLVKKSQLHHQQQHKIVIGSTNAGNNNIDEKPSLVSIPLQLLHPTPHIQKQQQPQSCIQSYQRQQSQTSYQPHQPNLPNAGIPQPTLRSLQPPSSSPAPVYADLYTDRSDIHSPPSRFDASRNFGRQHHILRSANQPQALPHSQRSSGSSSVEMEMNNVYRY